MRLPVNMASASFQSCYHQCMMANGSASSAIPVTTLVVSLAQETISSHGNSSSNNGRYANELTIIFGVTATVLALGSFIFTYLAWRVYKHPECSPSRERSLSSCIRDVAMLREVLLPRQRRPASYGAGSRFEDGCIEMQNAAMWNDYCETIDMPTSPR